MGGGRWHINKYVAIAVRRWQCIVRLRRRRRLVVIVTVVDKYVVIVVRRWQCNVRRRRRRRLVVIATVAARRELGISEDESKRAPRKSRTPVPNASRVQRIPLPMGPKAPLP